MVKSAMATFIVVIIVLVLVVLKEGQCWEVERGQSKLLHQFKTKIQQHKLLMSYSTPPPPPPPTPILKREGRVFYPIGYGADPTGVLDSSSAIEEALKDAVNVTRTRTQSTNELLPGIADLGGIVIHLQGGTFTINTPIRFPPAIANILVQGGSLRASNTFPGDRHLIELWAPTSPAARTASSSTNSGASDSLVSTGGRKDINNGMQYEDITFRDILFDSSYRGGGLLVDDSARIRVISCFFLHFTTQGILVQRGHETFVSDCFLGQHPSIGGDREEKNYSGTAIDIASTDNAVTDVAIFSAGMGIVLRGQANIVTGVHCYNKAVYFGGVGILVKSAQNRIVNSYLDFNSIVIEDPAQVHISNGYFLGDGNIVLKSVQGRISGLTILNNIFCGNPKNMVPIVKLDGQFSSFDQVMVDHNVVNGMSLKSTAGRLAVAGNGTKWAADFSPVLLFPDKINQVQYSFYIRGGINEKGFPAHAVTNVSRNVVVIESQQAVDALVSVSVDQHNMPGDGNLAL